MAIICPFTTKCVACKYNRPDPERNGEYSCFLKADLEQENKKEKKVKKMKVYVVVSNGDVKGEIEGVFAKYEDAKACFDCIKTDWQDWARDAWSGDSDIEEQESLNYYYLANYDSDDNPMEVSIIEKEVQ